MSSLTEFKKLLIASFISQIGSHFLTLSLSAFVLVNTHSAVLSSLVFVFSFLPSMLVGPKLGYWVDEKVSRWLIVRNELASILATILCGLCIYLNLPVVFLCGLLGLRSILLFIGRAASTKWLKLISPPEVQTSRIKLFYLVFFLSTAIAGILTAQVLQNSSIWLVVSIDSASYLLGLLVYLQLKPITLEKASSEIDLRVHSLRETLASIFSVPALRTSFLVVCISQAIFQGAYSSLVSFLPIQHFHLGVEGIGWFQLAASIGIIGGFLLNWYAPKLLNEKIAAMPVRAFLAAVFAATSVVICSEGSSLRSSLSQFIFYNLAYEFIWLHHNSAFFRASTRHEAARYQFTLASTAAFVMALVTLAYASSIEYFGVTQGVLYVMGATVVLAIAIFFLSAQTVFPFLRRKESQ